MKNPRALRQPEVFLAPILFKLTGAARVALEFLEHHDAGRHSLRVGSARRMLDAPVSDLYSMQPRFAGADSRGRDGV